MYNYIIATWQLVKDGCKDPLGNDPKSASVLSSQKVSAGVNRQDEKISPQMASHTELMADNVNHHAKLELVRNILCKKSACECKVCKRDHGTRH